MYEQGDSTYLDVLLNSSGFSNTLSNIETMTHNIDYDKEGIAESATTKENTNKKRDELQKSPEKLSPERIQEMYEQGDATYLDILLDSSSSSNMLSHIETVTQTIDYNKKRIAESAEANKNINKKRDYLQSL